jgi:hypothetical protein
MLHALVHNFQLKIFLSDTIAYNYNICIYMCRADNYYV